MSTWIPVNERLPERDHPVPVTLAYHLDSKTRLCTGTGRYVQGRDEHGDENGEEYWAAYTAEEEWEDPDFDGMRVIAWMEIDAAWQPSAAEAVALTAYFKETL